MDTAKLKEATQIQDFVTFFDRTDNPEKHERVG
jgi:hypothetical protein